MDTNKVAQRLMNDQVTQKFDSYPDAVCIKLMQIRTAIFETAEKDNIGELIETLKWGEISYLAKGGSTVRMDWKQEFPNQCYVYFHCQTSLVETFKIIYQNILNFEGNRAVVISLLQRVPMDELMHCISLSLRYHKIKHLPFLGVGIQSLFF